MKGIAIPVFVWIISLYALRAFGVPESVVSDDYVLQISFLSYIAIAVTK